MIKRKNLAEEILTKFGKVLKKKVSNMYSLNSIEENYEVAKFLYENIQGEIISTSFFENPKNYLGKDLIKKYKGSNFTRITTEDICDNESYKICLKEIKDINPNYNLIRITRKVRVTLIDGIFCKLDDNSFICFISFYNSKSKVAGEVYLGELAKNMYNYYNNIL